MYIYVHIHTHTDLHTDVHAYIHVRERERERQRERERNNFWESLNVYLAEVLARDGGLADVAAQLPEESATQKVRFRRLG